MINTSAPSSASLFPPRKCETPPPCGGTQTDTDWPPPAPQSLPCRDTGTQIRGFPYDVKFPLHTCNRAGSMLLVLAVWPGRRKPVIYSRTFFRVRCAPEQHKVIADWFCLTAAVYLPCICLVSALCEGQEIFTHKLHKL